MRTSDFMGIGHEIGLVSDEQCRYVILEKAIEEEIARLERRRSGKDKKVQKFLRRHMEVQH